MPPDLEDAPRPSRTSQRRLADRLRCEIADVRMRLDEATLRSDAHLLAGDLKRAEGAVRDQRELIQRLQQRLNDIVAEAAVEREAESVLLGLGRSALDGPPPTGGSADVPGGPADLDEPPVDDAPDRRPLATVGAVMAAVLSVLLGVTPQADTDDIRTVRSVSEVESPRSGASQAPELRALDGALAETAPESADAAASSASAAPDPRIAAAGARLESRSDPAPTPTPLVEDYVARLLAEPGDGEEEVGAMLSTPPSEVEETVDEVAEDAHEIVTAPSRPDPPDVPETGAEAEDGLVADPGSGGDDVEVPDGTAPTPGDPTPDEVDPDPEA